MTTNLNSNSRRRGATAAGMGGLALASVLLLCGAGNAPIANFSPQGAMQADLNAGGRSVTNAASVIATNVGTSNLSATSAAVGSLTATNLTVTGALTTTNAFLTPAAIGTTVQAYNAGTTALGNTVNGTNSLVQTDGNGILVDSVLRTGTKTIHVSKSLGSDTRTGLSKYSLITPFATLTAAAGAAASGDIIVAEDGVFTDKNLVLVSGVNWFFMPGATITITGAANGDVIFKDGGTAALAVTIEGCGQTFAITSTTTSTTVTGLNITAQSTVTLFGIGLTVNDSVSGSTAAAVSCSGGSSQVTITGNLQALGGSAGYGIYFSGSSGGGVVVNGNVTGTAPIYGYGFYATGTTAGSALITQKLTGSYGAVNNSTVTTVTCGQLVDTNALSLANNHVTIYCPVPIVQLMSGATTGFNDPFWYGPQDQVMELTASGTLASGTVTFPADNATRIGQRLMIMSTQTITALTVSVASGTIYGWSGGTFGPGSITFQKIAANVWAKL